MTGLPVLRMGLLGAALIAPTAFIQPARTMPEVQVVAVAARDPARARAFAARHGIPRFHESYEALLADPEIEAVYIPLPNGLHAEWSIKALQAGKQVLCEKPLAANAGEAERMAEVAAETGLVLAEAFHYRFHPLAARLKEIVDSGELGAVGHIEAHFCIPMILPGNIRYRYELAGGATMDVGCYPINLIRFLAGAEPEVTNAQARLASAQIDRWMKADFRFPDGRTGRMVCSLLSLTLLRARATVQGETGELQVTNPFLPHVYHQLKVRSRQGNRSEHIPGRATYRHQLQAFVKAVRGKAPILTNATDAIANMRVIDAIYEKAGLQRRGM